MLSGHFQGRVLSMLSKIINPKHILEIGTYTGYATLCLAEGLQENGIIYTIDNNEELYDFQKKYFENSQYKSQIKQHLGNALDIIETLNTTYDLVFIDADKENYINYYNLIVPKMNKNGVILTDNVLWSGKVVDPQPDKDTRAILEFNRKVQADPRVENLLLSLRDGIMMMYKK